MPRVSNLLLQELESTSVIDTSQLKQLKLKHQEKENTAIVVLSGGRLTQAAEYGNIDVVNQATLQRLKYAAWLHRKIELPIMLSGGSKLGEATSEAVLMNQTMLTSFNIAPKWIESKSRNTQESAHYAAMLLKQQGIEKIVLVTHAWHIQRAKRAFQQQSLQVIAAPTGFFQQKYQQTSLSHFFPNPKALQNSHLALREILNNFTNGIIDYYQ